jgi:Tol biopolymer transport system component
LNLSLLNLKNGTSTVIDTANQSVWDVDISPDRHTLAYSWFNDNTSKWEVVLIDNEGNFQDAAWSSKEDFTFRGWLNDHQLVVSQVTYMVVDPYQNSQLSFSPFDFPDFNLYDSKFFVSFSPNLSKAVYKAGSKIDVLDPSSNTILARIKDGYDRTPIVSWRSSDEQAAFVSSIAAEHSLPPDEIFILEKDAQVRQLTNLYDTFGLPLTIDNLSWSPDGSKIAFWLHDKEANSTLMVTDYATGNTVNYCIINVAQDSFPISVSAPIWSPDGKYLMVENRYANDKNRVLIVDLSTNSAFPIAENASPVGWMIEKP